MRQRVGKEQATRRSERGRSRNPNSVTFASAGRAAALQRGAGGAACGGGGAARGAPAAAAAALAPAVVPAAAPGRRAAPPRAARAAGPGTKRRRLTNVMVIRVRVLEAVFLDACASSESLLLEQLDQVRRANISSRLHCQCRFTPIMRSLLPVPGQQGHRSWTACYR